MFSSHPYIIIRILYYVILYYFGTRTSNKIILSCSKMLFVYFRDAECDLFFTVIKIYSFELDDISKI